MEGVGGHKWLLDRFKQAGAELDLLVPDNTLEPPLSVPNPPLALFHVILNYLYMYWLCALRPRKQGWRRARV